MKNTKTYLVAACLFFGISCGTPDKKTTDMSTKMNTDSAMKSEPNGTEPQNTGVNKPIVPPDSTNNTGNSPGKPKPPHEK